MEYTSLKMKTGSKIFKRIFIGLLLFLFICISVFVVVGFVPVKDIENVVRKSCYIPMKDGTKIAVRFILPSNLRKDEKVPAIMESTRYGTESKRSHFLKAILNLGIAHEVHPVERLSESGYALVEVDARGSGASFGSREMEWSKEEVEDMW